MAVTACVLMHVMVDLAFVHAFIRVHTCMHSIHVMDDDGGGVAAAGDGARIDACMRSCIHA
jgi:hypothetical protein